MATEFQLRAIEVARDHLQGLVDDAGVGLEVDDGVLIVSEPPTLRDKQLAFLVHMKKVASRHPENERLAMRDALTAFELYQAYVKAEEGLVRFSRTVLDNYHDFQEKDAAQINQALDCLIEYLPDAVVDMIGPLATIQWCET